MLAQHHSLASIAFPAISTGAYVFPPQRAAMIALKTVLETLDEAQVEQVIFCCFGADSRHHHEKAKAGLDTAA
jgi:O-acetyl-ADP-ribose deacetylase (regulator of RNase III)